MRESNVSLPRWLKLGFTLWIVLWAPTFAVMLGAQNYFWLCNLASFLILVGLWWEHRLLLSMQLLAVLLVGTLWGLDVLGAWLTGVHPIGGTEYMFDPDHPTLAKALSFYHLVLPLVAGFAVWRLGYVRRALLWQTVLTWVVVPLTFLFTATERNINWVHGPFGSPQDMLHPLVYLVGLMLAWPVVLYLPVHALMRLLQRRGVLR
ncbi:hypothetical protein HOP52_00645 [Halomonas campisalis]|uniref:Membrane-associated protein n=1 Tax=Billgrantia campisalis TaxID=74661 RepID=A0ABS9P3B9_9GAMM|nr:hypothetical protein [Halomonas campisalis]MCG6656285.1 hypothetical protein [Halomonas campisalis]MDR5861472.1 hypothetical protein [Halomonas campisalis]